MGLLDNLYANLSAGDGHRKAGLISAAQNIGDDYDTPLGLLADALIGYSAGRMNWDQELEARTLEREKAEAAIAESRAKIAAGERAQREQTATRAGLERMAQDPVMMQAGPPGTPNAMEAAGGPPALGAEQRSVLRNYLDLGQDDMALKYLQSQLEPAADPLSPVGKLIRELGTHPPGSPGHQFTLGALKKAAESEGLAFNYNPETGAFNFAQGPGVKPTPFEAPGASEQKGVREGVTTAAGSIETMGNLIQTAEANPDFFETWSHLRAEKLEQQEKLGMGITPEDRAWLTNYTTFHSNSARDYNARLRAEAGANLTENEIKRYELAEGSSMNDSQTQYLAKTRGGRKALSLGNARRIRMVKENLNPSTGPADKNYSLSQTEAYLRDNSLEQYNAAFDAALSRLGKTEDQLTPEEDAEVTREAERAMLSFLADYEVHPSLIFD